jgi:hypothetical protein
MQILGMDMHNDKESNIPSNSTTNILENPQKNGSDIPNIRRPRWTQQIVFAVDILVMLTHYPACQREESELLTQT